MSSLEQHLAERHSAEVLGQTTDLARLGDRRGILRNTESSTLSRSQFNRQEEAALTNANALTRVERHIFATSGTFTVGVNDTHQLQEAASTEMVSYKGRGTGSNPASQTIQSYKTILRTNLKFSAPAIGALYIRLFYREPPEGFPNEVDYLVREDSQILEEDGFWVGGMRLTIYEGWPLLARFLVKTLPSDTNSSHEAYALTKIYNAGGIVLPGQYLQATAMEKNALLLDENTRMDIFLPYIKPEWGLPELGAMKKVPDDEDSPNDVYSKMTLQNTGYFVDEERMKTLVASVAGSEPSVLTTVGVKAGSSKDYVELNRICKEIKANYLETGENQSETFKRKDGVEFEIEYKSEPNDTWHDEDQGDDECNEYGQFEYGQFELSDSEDESDEEMENDSE